MHTKFNIDSGLTTQKFYIRLFFRKKARKAQKKVTGKPGKQKEKARIL
tara:strand:+ start:96 stop:239 length:144 start_codon:yes stop_codon:yes gene_type:complete